MFNDPTGRKLIEEQRDEVFLIVGLCLVSAAFPWVGVVIAVIAAIAHGIDTLNVRKNEREINNKLTG